MVGRPNELRTEGSSGDGERNRGISFMGDVADLDIEDEMALLVLGDLDERESPKNPVFSFDGEGSGGGPMSDVDLLR